MKKILSYAVGALLLLPALFNTAAAGPYVFEPLIIPLDCAVFDTCAVYVNDETYVGPADGTKSAYYQSITAAVNRVKSDDDYSRIIIADGTYSVADTSETFPFSLSDADSFGVANGIYVYGGYSNDFSTVDPDAYHTIIDANDAVENIFYVTNLKGKISGVEIENAYGGPSAPIHISNKGATSYNFIVEHNTLRNNEITLGAHGVLVELDGSNSADVYGNMFTNNTGGGLNNVLSVQGDANVYNNVLVSNEAWGIIGCAGGAKVYNNYVLSNEAQYGINAWGDCSAYNNTVVGNTIAAGAEFAAMRMSGDGNVLANNLVAGNSGNQSFYHYSGDTSTFEYNALFDNGSDPAEGDLTDGNVLCDPLFGGITFVDPDDTKLGEGSACIDMGKVVSSVTEDYYGATRPLDGNGDSTAAYDPGAYEAPVLSVPGVAPVISGLSAAPSTFSPDADGTEDSTTVSFNIDADADVTVSILNSSAVEMTKVMDAEAKTAGAVLAVWNGENDVPEVVADGTYTVKVDITNADGSDSESIDVVVDTSGVTPSEQCAGYSDVPASHPDCDAIEYMQSVGSMTGNPDGTFDPDEYLQRDQIAKVVLVTFSLFDETEDYCNGTDPFPDVTNSAWSYQYICRGVDLGMITGYEAGADAGKYIPGRSVNRAEFLALTLRNLSDTMPGTDSTSYTDVEAGQWFSGYAKYSQDNGLFVGSKLFPTNSVKRAEVAKVIYELYNLGKV